MSKKRRQKVSFIANKRVIKPIRVKFYTRSGKKISFISKKKVVKPVKVEFYVTEKQKA